MTPDLAVIVPTHDGRTRLGRLLHSLDRQTLDHDLVVVDNGSADGTADWLRGAHPRARVISLPTNVGFARAVNKGAAATDAATLVFLNNDVICEEEFLERLLAALDPGAGIAMAAAALARGDASSRIDTAGIEVDPVLVAYDFLHGAPLSVLDEHVGDPLGPSGAAGAVDATAFRAVGGFDEAFFAYLEDVDLALRLTHAGARCRLARDARGVHLHSATLGARSRRKHELVAWGHAYLLGKYRIHRSPPLLLRAMASELTDAAGKFLVDGCLVGVGPRVAGWRRGIRAPAHDVPAAVSGAPRISFREGTQRRIGRRLIIPRGHKPGPNHPG